GVPRELEPDERTHESGLGAREVDVDALPAGEPSLRSVTRPLGALAVDLVRSLRVLGEDDHLVVSDLGEAAGQREMVLGRVLAIYKLADAERGQQGRVAGQDAEVALTAREDDLIDGIGDDEPRRRRHFQR